MKLELVDVIKFYIQKLSHWGDSGQILFPTLWRRGNLVKPLRKIASYNCVLKQFKTWAEITKIKGKPADYGLHSFRRGAVTNAANNNCGDHLIMKAMNFFCKKVHTYATLNAKTLSQANRNIFKKKK